MNILSNFNNLEMAFTIYLLAINSISLILFVVDKRKAKKDEYRIPEWILLFISFLGGSTGALISMVIFKHKLYKKMFSIGIPLFLILNKLSEMVILNYIKIK